MAGVDTSLRVDRIVETAAQSSDVWARSVLDPSERNGDELFGPIAGELFADGVETIYEGYLVHHAPRGRAFAAPDREQALLLGDYLYATGLVQVCAAGDVEAIAALADLICLAAHLRAEGGIAVDAELWLATTRHLAGPRDAALLEAREALRKGDPRVLCALVADADATGPLAQHRCLMGDIQ